MVNLKTSRRSSSRSSCSLFPLTLRLLRLRAGVAMWEIYSEGRTPFENRSNLEVVNDITKGIRLYRPHRASQSLYSVMYSCWHEVRTAAVSQQSNESKDRMKFGCLTSSFFPSPLSHLFAFILGGGEEASGSAAVL